MIEAGMYLLIGAVAGFITGVLICALLMQRKYGRKK